MRSVVVRAGAAVGLVLGLSGCVSAASASIAGKDAVVIGVKADQPGLGQATAGGSFEGFEVEVGKYVARRMGASQVRFRAVTSENRERLLRERKVDLVLASYSITAERLRQVTFGGPYYVAHQDIMVRRSQQGVHTVRDLAGRRMCRASGSVSTERITDGLGIRPRLVPAGSYGECYDRLVAGQVDVVSTGDLVLAGFVRKGGVRILNAPFTDERYGVGLRRGDIDGCEAVNRALTLMYQDGTASRLLHTWFGSSGLNLVETVPEFEGCS